MQRDLRGIASEISRELTQVAALSLQTVRGFATLETYADAELWIYRDAAYQTLRVAEAFGEEMVRGCGVEKLDCALRCPSATSERDAPEDLPDLLIRVPGDDGGVREPLFEEVTLAQLRAAVRTAREDPRVDAPNRHLYVARSIDADAALEVQDALNAAMEDALGGARANAEARVTATHGRAVLELPGEELA